MTPDRWETGYSSLPLSGMTVDAHLEATAVSVAKPRCPICSSDLVLGGSPSPDGSDSFDCWSCPGAHGLAMTLSEGHVRLQRDELAQIWTGARSSDAGPLPSPFTGSPMIRVAVEVDADDIAEGEQGDGPTTATVVVDVDVENQFIWLDAGELGDFPDKLPDVEPSDEMLEAEQEIIARFGRDFEDAVHERESRELAERLYLQVARHPGTLRALDSVGRTLTTY